jgi:hypothetical protein
MELILNRKCLISTSSSTQQQHGVPLVDSSECQHYVKSPQARSMANLTNSKLSFNDPPYVYIGLTLQIKKYPSGMEL